MLIAVPLAAIAATKRDRMPDHVVRAVPLVGLGFPPFWLGIMLLLVFGLHLGRAFPVGGYGSGFVGHLHSMFLPALTVALGIAPILIRSLRASLLEVLESDYVTTARSKGLPGAPRARPPRAAERGDLDRHGARRQHRLPRRRRRSSIEQVFALPGIGQLMINSIFQRDFPVVQAVTLVFAIMVVLVYLLTDVVHALLDPRVRFD